MRVWQKILFFLPSVVAWYLTVANKSIIAFNQPLCEAINNDFLTEYKLIVEVGVLLVIFFSSIFSYRRASKEKRKKIIFVSLSLLLFFSVFSVTEYVSSLTGIYEINLYGLFVLPVFLMMIIYSIVDLEILKIKHIGNQLLAYLLIIMVGSQFFFLTDTTDKTLTGVTFVLSLCFGFLLVRSSRREVEARELVEKQKTELEAANKAQSDLLHFVSHQVKGFLTNTKAALSMILEGDYGPVPEPVKEVVQQTFVSEDRGVTMVQSFLNAARIDEGSIEYTMKDFDLKKMVEDVVKGESALVKELGLNLSFSCVEQSVYMMNGDPIKFREVIFNLIDNAVKYTPKGTIAVHLERLGNTIRFSVKDSGVGINEGDRARIFTKYGHGKESKKINVHSNGLGLYLVKNVVDKHNGKVWFESDGTNGTTFFVEVAGV